MPSDTRQVESGIGDPFLLTGVYDGRILLHTDIHRRLKMSNFENTKMPEVKFNKNGYEIRADILAMAKDMAVQEFQMRWQGWEMTSTRDEKTGQIVTTVGMPEFPGLDKVLETAERMYSFVNATSQKR